MIMLKVATVTGQHARAIIAEHSALPERGGACVKVRLQCLECGGCHVNDHFVEPVDLDAEFLSYGRLQNL